MDGGRNSKNPLVVSLIEWRVQQLRNCPHSHKGLEVQLWAHLSHAWTAWVRLKAKQLRRGTKESKTEEVTGTLPSKQQAQGALPETRSLRGPYPRATAVRRLQQQQSTSLVCQHFKHLRFTRTRRCSWPARLPFLSGASWSSFYCLNPSTPGSALRQSRSGGPHAQCNTHHAFEHRPTLRFGNNVTPIVYTGFNITSRAEKTSILYLADWSRGFLTQVPPTHSENNDLENKTRMGQWRVENRCWSRYF
jgi:hypothetical protein